MTRKLLYILFASAMLMGGNFKAVADPIIEVNAIDFNQVGISFIMACCILPVQQDSAFLSITS